MSFIFCAEKKQFYNRSIPSKTLQFQSVTKAMKRSEDVVQFQQWKFVGLVVPHKREGSKGGETKGGQIAITINM